MNCLETLTAFSSAKDHTTPNMIEDVLNREFRCVCTLINRLELLLLVYLLHKLLERVWCNNKVIYFNRKVYNQLLMSNWLGCICSIVCFCGLFRSHLTVLSSMMLIWAAGARCRSGVLNLFMVRANMKNGLYAGGHEYTYVRSKSLYSLFAHKRFANWFRFHSL